jgi:hypothetical protein
VTEMVALTDKQTNRSKKAPPNLPTGEEIEISFISNNLINDICLLFFI